MRDWNTARTFVNGAEREFWSYLWGIETIIDDKSNEQLIMFWSYLWGIETRLAFCVKFCIVSFDLTYEGLKPTTCVRKPLDCYVLILPMRDWNYRWGCDDRGYRRFWSYLWGIETYIIDSIRKEVTSFDLTYEGLKLAKQLGITPNYYCFDLTYEGLKHVFWTYGYLDKIAVLILPMRDWNRKEGISQRLLDYCFDLTYEGLKLVITVYIKLFGYRFDLTYEGLKHRIFKVAIDRKDVLILPMRDWNQRRQLGWHERQFSFDLTYEGLKLHPQDGGGIRAAVLILPMRDWNYHTRAGKWMGGSFWSYLWGIETKHPRVLFFDFRQSFDLTYEGLKLPHEGGEMNGRFVLILPMRDWNLKK